MDDPLTRGFGEAAPPPPPIWRRTARRNWPPGEMKQVSVLFCDIVGSTALTEELGAERMHELVTRFLDAALAEVHRYEGNAPQFSGDGFMALFGAPVAYEDHVRRALLAALAIRRALGSGDGNAVDQAPLNLSVRIGVHTGPVVFAPVADSFRIETAIGQTANLAARLQQAAEPGAILISEATRQAAAGYVRVDAVGPLALKGVPEPVTAYRVLGISHRSAALDPTVPARRTPFVGRNDELAFLLEWQRQAAAGEGRAVTIVGEPGIGKSRLLAEFRRHLPPGGVTWVEGRCHSYSTAIPYWLALDVLRGNCGIVETDDAETIAAKVRSGLREIGMDAEGEAAILLHLLGIGGPAPSASPETVKAKAFEVLRRIPVEGSRRRPLVLVLEDLHWIDKVSEELCAVLADSIVDSRILLLGLHRPDCRPPWEGKPYARRLALRPLSVGDSLQVVRAAQGDASLAESVAEEIVAKADGNPFFLEQLALHAGEAGTAATDLLVPGTIHEVVMARIDRLPEDAKQLVQTAAVIGREFSLRLLQAVDGDPDLVGPALNELRRLEFIEERLQPDGTAYIFRHQLTQEAAYGSLLERHRRARHADIGRALEQLYDGRNEEVAELLALHYGRSAEAEKAVDYAILAAEKAQRRWANSDALTYFAAAQRRLDTMPANEANRLRRIDAVLLQGELRLALGGHAEHLEALDKIREIVEESDDPRRRATWHYWAGFLQILTGGRAATAIGHCRQAAQISSAASFHELDGFIASCLAQAYIVAGELTAAIEAGQRALSIFEADGNLWWASRALWHLSSASNCLGQWEASHAYCRRALEYGTFLNDLRLKVAGLWRTASTYVQQGDSDRGLQYCEDALALAPIPFDAAAARMVHGYGLVKAGNIQAGVAELREVVTRFEASRLSHLRLLATLWLAEGCLALGDCVAARPLAEEVLFVSRSLGYDHFEGVSHRLLGECLATEVPAEADGHVEAALRILDRTGARNDFAKALVTKAKLRRVEGGDGVSRQLLERAYAIFQSLGTCDEPVRVKAALARMQGWSSS